MQFSAVYLLHGTGGSPNGSVLQLEMELRVRAPEQLYVRPLMPHSEPTVAPSVSVSHLRELAVPKDALVIGISLGGLVAAKLQEADRPDLYVFCINSPTWAGDIELKHRMNHRVSLYCSDDEVIAGRTDKWPKLAAAYDLPWLAGHNTDSHKDALASILNDYLETGKVSLATDGLHGN